MDDQRAYWLETAGLALASVLLFRFGLLGLVFLVPIQLVWIRRGEYAGLIASGGVLLGVAAFKAIDLLRLRQQVGGGELSAGVLLLDLVFVFGLLLGLFVMNSGRVALTDEEGRQRVLTVGERMVVATVAGALVYGPAIAILATGESASQLISMQIELVRPLFESAGATSEEIALLTDVVVGALLSGLLFGYFLLLIANWWIGLLVAFRSRLSLPAGNPVMARASGYELTEFTLPPSMVWVLIGGWGGVLLSMVAELGGVAYVFWNVAFVSLALYGIQGIAIVWYYLDRRKAERGVRIAVAIGLVFGLLIPGLRLVVGLGLPGLGVSEMWIDYHRLKGSEEAE
ncbi:MAG: DUF2232 domain-containing protein [Spirochaetota bacterium]